MAPADFSRTSPSSCSSAPSTPTTPSHSQNLPFTLITAPTALVSTLSALLQSAVLQTDGLPPPPPHTMTVFHALEPPSISVPDYVARVAKYVFCSEACLILSYDYMLRAVRRHSSLALSSLSVHRLFITSVVLACKFLDDVSYNLAYYAKVGGLPTTELANLEIHMLRLLDFRLDISPQHFIALEQAMVTDLHSLCPPHAPAIVVDLAGRARNQLADADIVVAVPTSPLSTHSSPIPSPPSSGASTPTPARRPHLPCDHQQGIDEHADETSCAGNPPRRPTKHQPIDASPVSSECPTDPSSISRNSSMNSVNYPECCTAVAPPGRSSVRDALSPVARHAHAFARFA